MDNFFDIFKDWGGQIMAAMGILGGLWAYFRHDRKIKSQEKILNEFQIKQIEKEQAKEKMAEMKANIISNHKGTARIRFVNAGKANANNIRIEVLTSEKEMGKIYYGANFGPYEVINPQSYREEKLFLCEGHPDTIEMKIIWNDEFKNDRFVVLSVPF
ncbi:MAG: hypothetical protein NC344_01295 [Bacteroidales bacterium]|nr:hypothetical protein [Bacteroidales bacterium]MCM1146472.1 hypothetical protein [Bacteroidales bacterium]MCM1205090.1 hypothetical protein [Bacillota bacterium]MCM1509336.1 hypothetical protein [Clostridium sp.]